MVVCGEGDESNGHLDAAFRRYTEVAALPATTHYAFAHLARFYLFGLGTVEVNHKKAYEAARRALHLGSHEGRWLLAYCLRNGIGTRRDPGRADWILRTVQPRGPLSEAAAHEALAAAERLLLLGADRGEWRALEARLRDMARGGSARATGDDCWHPAMAQLCLGQLYSSGGVEDRPVESHKYYRLAAERGVAVAQLAVGVAAREGRGTRKDLQESTFWLRRAIGQGDPVAHTCLATSIIEGHPKPSEACLAEAERLLSNAARRGGASVDYHLGRLHMRRAATAAPAAEQQRLHLRKARAHFSAAAHRGNDDARCQLAALYLEGIGVDQDAVAGASLVRQAALRGSAAGMGLLSLCYRHGAGIGRSERLARKWARRAAERAGIAEGRISELLCLRRGDDGGSGSGSGSGGTLRENWAHLWCWAEEGEEQEEQEEQTLDSEETKVAACDDGEDGESDCDETEVTDGESEEEEEEEDEVEEAARDVRSCNECGATDKPLKWCSGCHSVRYCDTQCQAAAWRDHRATCRARAPAPFQTTAQSDLPSSVHCVFK